MASREELLISRSRTLRSCRARVVGSGGSGAGSDDGMGVAACGGSISEIWVMGLEFVGCDRSSM